jgi:hypothetical protein
MQRNRYQQPRNRTVAAQARKRNTLPLRRRPLARHRGRGLTPRNHPECGKALKCLPIFSDKPMSPTETIRDCRRALRTLGT